MRGPQSGPAAVCAGRTHTAGRRVDRAVGAGAVAQIARVGVAVDAAADLSLVPPDPALEPLLSKCVHGEGSAEEVRRLGELWQGRVKTLLLDLAHDPGVYIVRPVDRRQGRAPTRGGGERRTPAGLFVVRPPL